MTNIDGDEILMVWILIIVQLNLYLCCVISTNLTSCYLISGNEERLENNNGMVLDNTVVQRNLYLCHVIPTNQVVISFQAMKNGHKTTMVWFLIIL
jgi:hypothetical protein